MIGFKKIEQTENIPNFKNLKNNFVIDNKIFLRQKMIPDKIQEIEKSSFGKDISSYQSKKYINSMSNLNDSLNVLRKNTLCNSRSYNDKKLQEPDDGNSWKLIDAFYEQGLFYCYVPEVDLQTGELQLFDKGGISELIKKNGFNTSGKHMLNEVTNWIQSSSCSKIDINNSLPVRNSTQTEIKTIFKQMEHNKDVEQMNQNQQILKMDFNLEKMSSLKSKLHNQSNIM